MKQTAVEWLIEEIHMYPLRKIPEYIQEQANAMFEEQIIDAYQAGDGDAYNLEETKTWAEQYYNETYGGEK
jgi:hypothetical protein